MFAYTLLIFACVDLAWTSSFDGQMIKDILAYKNSQRVMIMGCNDGKFREVSFNMSKKSTDEMLFLEFVPLAKDLMLTGVFVQSMHYTSNDTFSKTPSSAPSSPNSYTIIADIDCSTVRKNIQTVEFQDKFNGSYAWLFIANEYKLQDLVQEQKKPFCLRLDSDVLWLQKAANSCFYHLIDLFALSDKRCGTFQMTQAGHWRQTSGLHIIDGFSKVKLRKNLHQTMLRGLFMHSTPDMLKTKLNHMYGNDTSKALGHELFHYALLNFLQEEHNFSVEYQYSSQERSEVIPSYDVVASGVFQSLQDKPLNARILLQSWTYRLGFIFRLTPELNGATRETSYLSPFTDTTWYSVASVLALVLGVLQCITIFHAELSSLARNHYLIDTIGLIAQQGTAQSSAYISLRIVLYAVLIMAFLLYNYYTASIVGELLSISNQGPATIDQLLNAPLAVMFANDSYNRALAVDNGTGGLMQQFVRQQHARVPDAMTSDRIYADVRTAVQLMKLGGYAFHCELTEAFRAIASHFDAHEICELRTMKGLYTELPLMSFVVPQGSMYAEQFKITLTRATEIGLIKRLLKTYSSDQPTCLGGPLVHPVVLAGVTAPFTILAAGFVSSFVIFLLEKIIYSMKTMSQPF
uniref:Ionotropic receptor 75a N-terminal domain-containing protein n=1 Tax=Anopheles gambiae TaxID=7165 RepID=A0A2Y9D2G3_ANOGA